MSKRNISLISRPRKPFLFRGVIGTGRASGCQNAIYPPGLGDRGNPFFLGVIDTGRANGVKTQYTPGLEDQVNPFFRGDVDTGRSSEVKIRCPTHASCTGSERPHNYMFRGDCNQTGYITNLGDRGNPFLGGVISRGQRCLGLTPQYLHLNTAMYTSRQHLIRQNLSMTQYCLL